MSRLPAKPTVYQIGPTKVLEPLLKLEEAAQILGRSHWVLRSDVKAGRLACVRLGRRIMIEPCEIRRLIEEGRVKHGSQ
jgi:hypothetical protein